VCTTVAHNTAQQKQIAQEHNTPKLYQKHTQNAKPKPMHKTKPKPKSTLIFNNCSYLFAYHCAQLTYTTQHRTALIIFPLILQTIITAQMPSIGEHGDTNGDW